MPLRDGEPLTVGLTDGKTYTIKSPMYNTVDGTRDGAPVPGAMAIQKVFDNYEWVSQPGNPVAYAPYLRKAPLPGVPAKSVIIQFAKGDQYLVNPTATAFLRAGDLADRATYYRYDLTPGYPADPDDRPTGYPHTFPGLITSPNPTQRAVALAAQKQTATFLATDGTVIIHPVADPNHPEYFETPIKGLLPEVLNYTVPITLSAPDALQGRALGSPAFGSIPKAEASHKLSGAPLKWFQTATPGQAGKPLVPSVKAASRSTNAALMVPPSARAVPVPSATPAASLVDRALEGLSPHSRLLRLARRRR